MRASAAWSTSSEGPPAFGPEASGAPEARFSFAAGDVGGERETRIPRALHRVARRAQRRGFREIIAAGLRSSIPGTFPR